MLQQRYPRIISEAEIAKLVTLEDARSAIREVFCDIATGDAVNYPVVRETLADSGGIFGIKSACYRRYKVVGLKAGGYFPGNATRGDTNHQSCVVLFDAETGKPQAMVSGNLLTKLRTAAAAALSIELMARADARVLGVIGAGAQAESHIRVALLARRFERVLVSNRSKPRAEKLAKSLADLRLPIEIADDAESLVRSSDVVITLTTSTTPIVMANWAQPGAHFACMGADTVGKQEVEATLVATARVFTDSVSQAVSIGECQAAIRAGIITQDHILGTLGEIIRGKQSGRVTTGEITLFDGTGVAAQDIAMAALAVARDAATLS